MASGTLPVLKTIPRYSCPTCRNTTPDVLERLERIRKEKDVFIPAHNYQCDGIQSVADMLGDSYLLAVAAKKAAKPIIAFCGVHFMAETAALLNPAAKVIIPSMEAGCGLADTINPDQLKAVKRHFPGIPTVMYINCTAAVKAESDVICTSGNAEKIVDAMPGEYVIYGPDFNLAKVVQKGTVKKLIAWEGYCPVHVELTAKRIEQALGLHPMATVLPHKECPTEALQYAPNGLGYSTEGILNYVGEHPEEKTFIIVTEPGIIHRLEKMYPGRTYYTVWEESKSCDEKCICPYMKKNHIANLLTAIEREQPRVIVPERYRAPATLALNRMIDITQGRPVTGLPSGSTAIPDEPPADLPVHYVWKCLAGECKRCTARQAA
jgi:quinolinate synthase